VGVSVNGRLSPRPDATNGTFESFSRPRPNGHHLRHVLVGAVGRGGGGNSGGSSSVDGESTVTVTICLLLLRLTRDNPPPELAGARASRSPVELAQSGLAILPRQRHAPIPVKS
jgi:hypothetical protein